MITMTWLFLSVLLWGFFHSLLAWQKIKDRVDQFFVPRVKRFYRLAYNIIACVSFLPVLALMFIFPDHGLYLVLLPWSGLMVLGELIAVAVLVMGLRQADPWSFLGFRQLVNQKESSNLTTSGLYRYVRHPLYTAGLVFIWLLPFMTINILTVNIALTIYVIVGAHIEERRLRGEYGQEYANYMAITPMFIPFLKRNKMPFKSS